MSGDRLDAIGIKEILAALPHRYPFLLVDRIIDIRGDEHGIGIKNVTINEPHFLGHFPNNPVMPGVLVLEGMAQTAGTLCIRSLPGQTKPNVVYFLTIDKAKFRKPVLPGQTLRITGHAGDGSIVVRAALDEAPDEYLFTNAYAHVD